MKNPPITFRDRCVQVIHDAVRIGGEMLVLEIVRSVLERIDPVESPSPAPSLCALKHRHVVIAAPRSEPPRAVAAPRVEPPQSIAAPRVEPKSAVQASGTRTRGRSPTKPRGSGREQATRSKEPRPKTKRGRR